MQVDTHRIYVYHPDRTIAAIGVEADSVLDAPLGKPAKPLIPGRGGIHRPSFLDHTKPEDIGQFQYFGQPYNFNTKYVVDCEADDTIGSHITLASGKRVWVDMSAESVHIMCNRR